ncbi:hypothetical protein [Peribacillus frigoritolerans]|uniref:Uncharacterized protein n=1 Tax=Peribacillus frigoritolerans TaxID=450367 RepID=A0AAJ1VAE3_9BACI|nr:hypothetical protein [Peribacillus frigoritolerans]MDM5282390.1 hypothetical protein [Peribacillus frigoritolerans]
MIRKGEYTIYNGKEYRFIESKSKGLIELISNNKEDMNYGFIHNKDNIYKKVISLNEVEKLFLIHSFAKYKGELFGASNGENGKILLATPHLKLAEKYGFERTDKYLYFKNVNLDEVEIIEERKPFSLD